MDYSKYQNSRYFYAKTVRNIIHENIDLSQVRFLIEIIRKVKEFTGMKSSYKFVRKQLTREELLAIEGPEIMMRRKRPYYGSGLIGYSDEFSIRRPLILDRDNDQCMLCGEYTNLVVHHIDCDKFNNHPTNLITLCRKCHMFPIHPTIVKRNKLDLLMIERLTKIAVKRSNIFFEGEGLPAKYERIFENIREKWA